jgi:hypothetical protein
MSDPALIPDPIIEAAARALLKHGAWDPYYSEQMAVAVLAAVTPLICAAALEEAAKVAESHYYAPQAFTLISTEIAAAIRALKPASPSPSDASA